MIVRNLIMSLFAMVLLSTGNAVLAKPDAKPVEVPTTVNINEADARTLAAVLDGVGLTRAEAIVLYRQENGKFYSAEELSSVRGIGATTVAKNEEKIKVK